MIHKTRGLVLHTIKYTDNSVISHIYTEHFGRISFLVSSARGKTSSARINLLHHLSILDMEVYIKKSRDLQRIKEIRQHEIFSTIPYDPVKNAVAIFVSEILYRTLQEQESNFPLFSYLLNAIKFFDLSEKGYANFHLLFLMGLTRHLGFYPNYDRTDTAEFFDIENARFTNEQPGHSNIISPPAGRYLSEVMKCSFEDMGKLRLTAETRNLLVSGILKYYNFHISGLGIIKSFTVLREIF
jgi:DNA repair protein RecO (recombination protein O)